MCLKKLAIHMEYMKERTFDLIINGTEWSSRLRLPEGGLYRVEACMHKENARCDWSPRIRCVRHIGVGDLYLITGQSNMAGYGKDVAYDPPCLGVHLYANNGKWDIASHLLNDSVDTIYPENKDTKSYTSPALSFGRRLKQEPYLEQGNAVTDTGDDPLPESVTPGSGTRC